MFGRSLASSSARSPPSTLPFLPGWGVGGSGGVFQFFQFWVCIVGPSCCGAPMGLCGLWVVRVWTYENPMRGLLPLSLPSPAPYIPSRCSGSCCSAMLGDLCLLSPGNMCCSSKRSAARSVCCGVFSAGCCVSPGVGVCTVSGPGVSCTASPGGSSYLHPPWSGGYPPPPPPTLAFPEACSFPSWQPPSPCVALTWLPLVSAPVPPVPPLTVVPWPGTRDVLALPVPLCLPTLTLPGLATPAWSPSPRP